MFDWHSFCTSLDFINMEGLVVLNGNIIAEMNFTLAFDTKERLQRLMKVAVIAALTGSVADIQIFSKPLTREEQIKWTLCQNSDQVYHS